MLGDLRSWAALGASLLLHLALALSFVVGILPGARSRQFSRDRADSWAGDTFEVDAVLGTGAPKSSPASEPQPQPTANQPAEKEAPAEPRERAKPAVEPKPTSAEPATEPPQKPEPATRRTKSAEAEEEKPTKRAAQSGAEAGQTDLRAALAAAAAGSSLPSYGAAGLEPGVRNLAKAFTRAIPASSDRDPIWSSLPLGPAGSLKVSIAIDGDGRIDSVEVLGKVRPSHLVRLVDKTVLLLRGGQFALSREGTSAKTEILELEASISMASSSDDPMEKGNRPPTPGHPGRAFFRQSGRTIEVRVSLEED